MTVCCNVPAHRPRVANAKIAAAGGALLLIAILVNDLAAQPHSGNNHLPMYGLPQIERPDSLRKRDEALVREATLKYGTPQAASDVLVAKGWDAFREKDYARALERFNQAWLLNQENYLVFWGFGAVLSERDKLSEAIEQLETARDLNNETKQRVALLADLGAVHSEFAARMPKEKDLERAHHFSIANQRFAESLELEPEYAPSWREWAISLYRQERYNEAWLKAKRAMDLKAEAFPPGFLEKVESKVAQEK